MAGKQHEDVSKAERQAEAKETLKSESYCMHAKLFDVFMVRYSFTCLAVKEISDLLNTGLDTDTLNICVQLLEAGVNPEALASVVKTIRQECAALKASVSNQYRHYLSFCLY